jgi:hypothetical protein
MTGFLDGSNDQLVGDIPFLGGANGAMQNALVGQSDFFNFEKFYLPQSGKELIEFSGHVFLTSDCVNPVIEKMAEYPITDFIFKPYTVGNAEDAEHQKDIETKRAAIDQWVDLFDNHLMAKPFAISAGIGYLAYGNFFASIYEPFDRLLQCGNKSCRYHHRIKSDTTNWEWERGQMNFILKCGKCRHKGIAKVIDRPDKNPQKINLISWYPGHISIDFCPFSGAKEFYLVIQDEEVDKIKKGNRLRLMNAPMSIIEAVKKFKGGGVKRPMIRFHEGSLFHMARPTIALPGADKGWGMPITVSILRSVFYLNMMKRAQTALLMEHILPFRYLFPSGGQEANSSIPIDLSDWRDRMRGEINKWKRDPLYIMLTPIPVGQGQMGGQGKALMLWAEQDAVRQDIVNGMNAPMEFIRGSMTYSGGNVSLRMLENQFINQIGLIIKLFQWVADRVSAVSDLERVKVGMKKFKMADDIQARQMMFTLWQSMAVSGETLGHANDFDYAKEQILRTSENIKSAVGNARAQGRAANEMLVIQSMFQQTLTPEQTVALPLVSPGIVEQAYQGLKAMTDPQQQAQTIMAIGQNNPALANELQMRASTDMDGVGANFQALLAANPQQRPEMFAQMSQQNPTNALILANLRAAFNNPHLQIPGGESAPTQGAPGGNPGMEKNMPDQKPPRRGGGSPM